MITNMATRMTSDTTSKAQPVRVRFDRFELDEAEARLTRDGQLVPLPPRPFAVLCALARAPQTLLTTNALLDSVWGHRFVSDSVLKSAISDLRAALQDDARQPRYIETVSRRGYRFLAAVSGPSLPAAVNEPWHFPARAQPRGSSPIGRAKELERLRSAWQAAAAGEKRILWIAGEAGVGKSTLAECLIGEVGETYSAYGHCVQHCGAGEPYLPVLEALAHLSRRDAALPELIRSVAPSWMVRFPWLSTTAELDALRREQGSGGEPRMLREMAELLDRYTQDRPLLLVTEDLHWSDRATVQLIDYMARRRTSARLLWLASFRLTEIIAADHPLTSVRRELRLHGLCDEIVLDAFSERQVSEYLAYHAPALAADESLVRAMHDRTGGLPLFVADMVDGLVAGPDAEAAQVASPLHVGWTIPESFAGIVDRYVEQLRPDQRSALEAASICGVEFQPSTVAHVLAADVASVAHACDELVRSRRWLQELSPAGQATGAEPRYAFRHSIYRDVICKRMSPFARAELRRRMAAWLERERSGTRTAGASRRTLRSDVRAALVPALIQ
jgi:DNA-binding winged helix-turn-helix (wHTH) protein